FAAPPRPASVRRNSTTAAEYGNFPAAGPIPRRAPRATRSRADCHPPPPRYRPELVLHGGAAARCRRVRAGPNAGRLRTANYRGRPRDESCRLDAPTRETWLEKRLRHPVRGATDGGTRPRRVGHDAE